MKKKEKIFITLITKFFSQLRYGFLYFFHFIILAYFEKNFHLFPLKKGDKTVYACFFVKEEKEEEIFQKGNKISRVNFILLGLRYETLV